MLLRKVTGKKLLFAICGFYGQKEKKHRPLTLQPISIILTVTTCSDISLMQSQHEKYGQLHDYLSFYCQ